MTRVWLIAGSLLLAGTAAFHMTGLESASEWLDGSRGRIIALLWTSAAINWVFVALIWTLAAIRPSAALRWPVWLAAMIPALTGVMLLLGVDAGHPGGYILIVSSILAAVGGWRLR